MFRLHQRSNRDKACKPHYLVSISPRQRMNVQGNLPGIGNLTAESSNWTVASASNLGVLGLSLG